MATKSFLKNVNLRSRNECQSFIRALERSDSTVKRSYDTAKKTEAHEMNERQIQMIFSSQEMKDNE